MDKAKVKKLKVKDNSYKVEFPSLTRGELLALEHALEEYSTACSAVAGDVLGYLQNALRRENIT